MPEDNNGQEQAAAVSLTPDAVTELVNKGINQFVHSQKTDIAKLKNEIQGLNSTITELRATPATTTIPTDTTQTVNNIAVDPKLSVLERQVKELQEANKQALEKAAKANRDNALGTALSKYTFANEDSREMAYKVFSSDITDLGDGTYAIGDQPLADAIKTRMEKLTGLLAPKQVGGSGASSGKPASNNLEYRKGMTKAEQQELVNHLAKQM